MIGPSRPPWPSQPGSGRCSSGLRKASAPTAGRLSALLACLSLLPSPVPGQHPANAIREIGPFQKVEQIEGLLHNTVIGIAQDHHGFIWMIGGSRLLRYDGNESRCFSNTPADSLLQRWTYSGLAGGTHGVLCIYGAADEVVLYDVDRSSADLYRLGQERSGASGPVHTTFAMEDARGRFVIATREGAVYRIDPRSREITLLNGGDDSRNGMFEMSIAALVEDSAGNTWAGGEKGIVYVTGPSEQTRGEDSSGLHAGVSPPDSVAVMFKGTGGRIWVATVGGDIGVFDPGSRRILHTAASIDPTCARPSGPSSKTLQAISGSPRDLLGSIFSTPHSVRSRATSLMEAARRVSTLLSGVSSWTGAALSGLARGHRVFSPMPRGVASSSRPLPRGRSRSSLGQVRDFSPGRAGRNPLDRDLGGCPLLSDTRHTSVQARASHTGGHALPEFLRHHLPVPAKEWRPLDRNRGGRNQHSEASVQRVCPDAARPGDPGASRPIPSMRSSRMATERCGWGMCGVLIATTIRQAGSPSSSVGPLNP